jgi:hypothetical protein
MDHQTAKRWKFGMFIKHDVDNPFAISGNGVYDIFHDESLNRVWVCTYSGGVSYFELGSSNIEQLTHQVNQPNSLVSNDVNSVDGGYR